MNEELIVYVASILKLRGDFSAISHVNKDTEAMKIWARWIITHRSICPQGNMFLPDDETYDSQFIIELTDKGVNARHAQYLHDWLIKECSIINNKFCQVATTEYGGVHGIKYPVTFQAPLTIGERAKRGKYITLKCNGITQSIPSLVYNRMSRMYQGLLDVKDSHIWLCATMYSLLDGKGLQWAIPPDVMKTLQEGLCCYTELFASPLNAYNSIYYSLFTHDAIFGSLGNFFTAPYSNFIEGTYQVNPPFIDPLFTKTTERILEVLDRADRDSKELTFIYIMPEWRDFITYNMVLESQFNVKQITLASGQHVYYQHDTSTYIPARFGSHIFFLSTNTKICSPALENNIKRAFSSGPRRY